MRFILFWLLALPLFAQGNYEIQVYGADTVEPHHTMVELHSNLTVQGSKSVIDGVYPTEHQWHETLEITHGFTDWFETGWYVFTSAAPGQGWQWVGDHIRPRVRVPERWKWPVGVSLSTEIGYQRRVFSPDTWTWEIRPIVDQKKGRWYWSFNPAFDRSFHGPSVSKGVEFSPNFKASYDFTPKVAGGLEYYGAIGPVSGFGSTARPAATDPAGHRSEPVTELGIRPGRRGRCDARNRSPAGEDDSWIPVQIVASYLRRISSHNPCALRISSMTSRTAPLPPG